MRCGGAAGDVDDATWEAGLQANLTSVLVCARAALPRLVERGGSIVIVNHFTSDVPVLGSMTEALDPLTRKLGWRTNLRLKPFIEAADLSVERAYKLSKTSLYTVVLGSKSRNGRYFSNGAVAKNTHH